MSNKTETIIQRNRNIIRMKLPTIRIDGIELITGEVIKFDIPRVVRKDLINISGVYEYVQQNFKKKRGKKWKK